MADNQAFGVNHDKMLFVVNQIYNSCENLNSIKLSFDELLQDFHVKYDGSFGHNFKNSLDDLSSKYEVVVKNILSFVEDFTKINNLAKNTDEELQINIKRDVAKFDSNYYIEDYK